jgi:hypothetical protein
MQLSGPDGECPTLLWRLIAIGWRRPSRRSARCAGCGIQTRRSTWRCSAKALAKRYYGNASQYQKIFEANRDTLDNPDRIKVGQKLRIP